MPYPEWNTETLKAALLRIENDIQIYDRPSRQILEETALHFRREIELCEKIGEDNYRIVLQHLHRAPV